MVSNPRFISVDGPDKVPDRPEEDIRFWGTVLTHDEAIRRKGTVDSSRPAGTTAVIFQSLVQSDPDPAQRQLSAQYLRLLDNEQTPDSALEFRVVYSEIAFDIFTVPTSLLPNRASLLAKVNGLLRQFSQQNPPGSAG